MLMAKFQQMPWYCLSMKSKSNYVNLLNCLQNDLGMRMGPFDQLNFETLSNVIVCWNSEVQYKIVIEKSLIFSDD